jgi:hypothetical protein
MATASQQLPEAWKITLDRPLTTDELYRAIHKGGGRKAPVRDGISNDFFKTNLDGLKEEMLEIFNQMLVEQKLRELQKIGVIVCIPKSSKAVAPNDFRPITLLNSDYKILSRIVEGQIRPALVEVLHASQYCGVTGKSIFDAVASARDAVTCRDGEHTAISTITRLQGSI